MLSDFFEPFLLQDWHSRPDGFGGVQWTVTDGAEISAGITTNSSAEMQVANAQGLKVVYTIVFDKALTLEQGDRVKRVKDGRTYVITSNAADMTTPRTASVQYAQVTAEVLTV